MTETERDRAVSAERRETDAQGARGERRQRLIPLFFPERRTGFDRRGSYPVTGHIRDNPRTLLVVLVIINILSLIDFAFTWVQLSAGTATEGNPALATLFAVHPFVAWLFKTTLVLGISVAIWHGRKYRAIVLVALLALVTYSALFVYHLLGMRASGLI